MKQKKFKKECKIKKFKRKNVKPRNILGGILIQGLYEQERIDKDTCINGWTPKVPYLLHLPYWDLPWGTGSPLFSMHLSIILSFLLLHSLLLLPASMCIRTSVYFFLSWIKYCWIKPRSSNQGEFLHITFQEPVFKKPVKTWMHKLHENRFFKSPWFFNQSIKSFYVLRLWK